MRHGRHFLHEHPQSAASWLDHGIDRMKNDPSIHIATADQCMYGLKTPTAGGGEAPARKATTFMTTSRQMATLLEKRCDGSHEHQPLVGGRCKDAAYYPIPLIQTILEGIRATKDSENFIRDEKNEKRALVHAISDAASQIPTQPQPEVYKSSIPKVGGGAICDL